MIISNFGKAVLAIELNSEKEFENIALFEDLKEKKFKIRGSLEECLLLIDLTDRNITGEKAYELLNRVNIIEVISQGIAMPDIKIIVNVMDLVLIDDEIEDNLEFIGKQMREYFKI